MKITLAHGSGGKEMLDFIEEKIAPIFSLTRVRDGIGLPDMEDGSTIPLGEERDVVVSIDSYTVKPLFFPGGNIGSLAICGSINDVAVMGAVPLAMLDAIVVEEGFEVEKLQAILESMEKILKEERVALIGGDFKVVPKGELDGVVISTVSIGVVERKNLLKADRIRPGDKIIVSGTVGDHGATILAAQEGISVVGGLRSDVAPVTKFVRAALKVGGVKTAKDPTRGGLAMTLNDFASASRLTIFVEEERIPIREEVSSYCEMLGVDPLSLANEGMVVMAVDPKKASSIVEALRNAGAKEATIIGEAREGRPGFVLLKTVAGGLRLLERPTGEIVPRIC
ncbi:MAG: hydrogenase expression/formation protein HypE [Thermoproteota archaeon]|nr:MAG: hydrogenase expression/formation protein HypE [Candidatus Korarchaeota archaeon]RLG50111.1 MAG: hydrogenase expression/formation protein HypE [Candidatus Korarchaeota archaeon]